MYNGIDNWRATYAPMMRALDGNDDPLSLDETWDDDPDLDPFGFGELDLGDRIPAAKARGTLTILPKEKNPGWAQADRVAAQRGVNPGRTDGGTGHFFDLAKSFLGTPYVFGAAGPGAFDCSGFTQYMYKRVFGISLPHQALQQAKVTKRVSRDQLQPGDLIFYSYGRLGNQIDHVEVYMGRGKQIGTSNPNEDLDIDDVDWGNVAMLGRVPGASGFGSSKRDKALGEPEFKKVRKPVERNQMLAPIGLANEELYGPAAFSTVLADLLAGDTEEITRKVKTPDALKGSGSDAKIKRQLYRGFVDAGRPDLARMVNTRAFDLWIRQESGWRPGATSAANNQGLANDGLFQIWRGHSFNDHGQVSRMSPYEQAQIVARYFGHLTPKRIRMYADQIREGSYGGWG